MNAENGPVLPEIDLSQTLDILKYSRSLIITMIQGRDTGKFFVGIFHNDRNLNDIRMIFSFESSGEGLKSTLDVVKLLLEQTKQFSQHQSLTEHCDRTFLTTDLIYEILGELQKHQRVDTYNITRHKPST